VLRPLARVSLRAERYGRRPNGVTASHTRCILQSADPLPNPLLTANGRINVLRGARCAGVPKVR
jgi:hypothetical protein